MTKDQLKLHYVTQTQLDFFRVNLYLTFMIFFDIMMHQSGTIFSRLLFIYFCIEE
uniref:Uncharacterized protein n=1 Tax=Tetranychus urticae TaxID=32264 RepID=T1L316_TETUR